jgi:AraC-like DNA-binding protein
MAHRRTSQRGRSAAIHFADVKLAPLSRFPLSPESPIVVHLHDSPKGRLGGDMHLAYEFGTVISGSVERDHGEGWFRLGVGQAWARALLEPHRWRIGARGARVLVFGFLHTLLARIPALDGFDPTLVFRSPVRQGAIGAGRRLRRSLAALGRELAPRYGGHAEPVRAGLACIDLMRTLALASEEAAETSHSTWRGVRLSDPQRIQPAVDLAEWALDRTVSVGEAARACGASRSTFDRVFRGVTGLGFATFALRCRLAAAAQALRATDTPIKAIAYRFGFKHISHFHHAFAAHYGMTPGRFRRTAAPLSKA